MKNKIKKKEIKRGGAEREKNKDLKQEKCLVCLLHFCGMGMGYVEQVHCQDGDICMWEGRGGELGEQGTD